MRLVTFFGKGYGLVKPETIFLRGFYTFHIGQLYGSAPDGLGIWSKSKVPWRFRRYSRWNGDSVDEI
jgi:hypothetical protein